jgi:ATP/maltotriose-dependent transcriptional regulator MalT
VSFASLDDIVALAGRVPPTAPIGSEADDVVARCDALLATLVQLAEHDDLALRVVLQRLMPGLVAAARRRAGAALAEGFDEVVGAAVAVVRSHGADHRPHLAARLVRAAEYHAFVRPHRRQMVQVAVAPQHLERADTRVTHAFDELVELLVVAHRHLGQRDLQLVRLIMSGATPPQMAEALQVSVRTVTNHRHALVHRLRQAALVAA